MRHKPSYHFRPNSQWINDPNGPIYFDGQYHLFYQYNPTGWEWGNLHWGHAVSHDLVHWDHLAPALTPDKARGEHLCFSGCAYEHHGSVELFYTSIGNYGSGPRGHVDGAQQWIATTHDMRTWTQIPENPVLSTEGERAQGRFLTHWRDPYVFRHRGETLMAIAGNLDGWRAAIHLYSSEDMRNWTYKGLFFSEGVRVTYECPNVIPFGDKLALIYTQLEDCVRYAVGTMNEDYTLNVIRHGEEIDRGCYCATNVFDAPDGRRIMWAWLREDDRGNIITDGDWQGAIALPRQVSLTADNRLAFRVADELRLLRGDMESKKFKAFSGRHEFDTHSGACEIEVEVDSLGEFQLNVLGARDLSETTRIHISPNAKTLRIARGASSLLGEMNKSDIFGRFGAYEGPLRLRAFVDHSILEVFINDEWAYAARVYPVNEDGILALEAHDSAFSGQVRIHQIG
ncbi:glycoside hydrolase family 32 protein [Eubacteriales bacterium OttesenSCG-928-N13]|nr:glycoside hydrolase family 32 protein [Eubacteriales bacterium OttesenSCG-928-N13]